MLARLSYFVVVTCHEAGATVALAFQMRKLRFREGALLKASEDTLQSPLQNPLRPALSPDKLENTQRGDTT